MGCACMTSRRRSRGPARSWSKVAGAGLCHSDCMISKYPVGFGRSDGMTIGHETAGWRVDTGQPVIVHAEFGCGVCEWCRRGGERFCPKIAPSRGAGQGHDGGMAEYIKAPARALVALPDSIDERALRRMPRWRSAPGAMDAMLALALTLAHRPDLRRRPSSVALRVRLDHDTGHRPSVRTAAGGCGRLRGRPRSLSTSLRVRVGKAQRAHHSAAMSRIDGGHSAAAPLPIYEATPVSPPRCPTGPSPPSEARSARCSRRARGRGSATAPRRSGSP